MNYEVEQKFPVGDLTLVENKLKALGATISEPRTEVDLYFNHPVHDYAQTDEALRLRRVGAINRITYKGPRIDATTKTREELDLSLPEGEAAFDGFSAMLGLLGFVPISEVRKQRRKAHVDWQNRRIEVSLDEVDRLGTFVELELVVSPDEYEAAKACIGSLAERLELFESERRSYLRLLLESTEK